MVASMAAQPALAQSRSFDIPAQPVASAIGELARQGDVDILVSDTVSQGRQSKAIDGAMTVEQALDRLLVGTGLQVRKTSARTFVVIEAPRHSSGAPVSSTNASATQNEIITVTAQRREEDVQDVSTAVTAISGRQIDERGTREFEDFARRVPGLTVSSFSEAEPIIAIRGAFNTFSQAGASKPVGVFIDDVYISRNSASTFQLFDLEAVEVLRGPQGTLFGRNVTGGAILLRTTEPDMDEVRAKAEVGYGNYDELVLRGLVTGPVTDTIAAKASISFTERDGYSTDRLIGREIDDLQAITARGALLFEPRPGASLLLAADYDREESSGRAISAIAPASADDGDIRTTETGTPQRYERETYGLSATANIETGIGDIVSITAYRESDAEELLAFSPVSFSLLPQISPVFPFQRIADNRDMPRTFSQEIRLASAPETRLGYIAGLYYFHEDISRDARTLQFTGTTGALNRDRTFFQDVATDSYAGFLDLSFALTDWITLSAGGRYTFESKSVSVDYEDALAPAANFTDAAFEGDYEEFTPRVAIEIEPSEDHLLYASYTQGFTAGGFNTEEPSIAVVTDPFEPETVDAYEIGLKSQFLDRRLALNVAGFVQEYKNKQEGFLTPTYNFVIRNASEATVKGGEVEGRAVIMPGLSLTGSYAYLDARYDEFVLDLNDEDRSGNMLPTSPEHSFSVGFDANLPVSDRVNLIANAAYSWQDDYYTGSENRPTFLIDSYDLANATIGIEGANGGWRVLLWADNIFDQDYVLVRSDFGAGGIGEAYGAPATYGVRVSFGY